MKLDVIVKDAMVAFNEGNLDRFETFLHPTVTYKDIPYKNVVVGPKPVVEEMRAYRRGYPDLLGETVRIVYGEDVAVIELIWHGTHRGELVTPVGSFVPTGRTLTNPACLVITFKDDKIVSLTHYYDMYSTLTQLALIPEKVLVPV